MHSIKIIINVVAIRFGVKLIARYWHGKVLSKDEREFEQFVKEKALPKFTKNPGFMDHDIIKKYEDRFVHFNVITYWQSVEYIKKFAGKNIEKAKHLTDDKKMLVESDDSVKHYEVVDHIHTLA